MGLSGKFFPSRKCRGEEVLAKNAVFADFSWSPRKNFQLAAIRTILILEPLPIGSFESLCPKFSKTHVKKVSISKIVGASPLRS